MIKAGSLLLPLLLLPARAADPSPPPEPIEFEAEHWDLSRGRIVEQWGRRCLAGSAVLKDVLFEDGVIEVDLAVSGARSYPGIDFHRGAPGFHEHVYVRPHRAGLYPDAVQYTPVMNGISGWQLYNGPGWTSSAELPEGEWLTLRLEVSGARARVFVGETEEPALLVDTLHHGAGPGGVGLSGPADGSACFSRFRLSHAAPPPFPPPAVVDSPPGLIEEWEISPVIPMAEIDTEHAPDPEWLAGLAWERVGTEPSGLVNLARYRSRSGSGPDVVLARATLHAERAQSRELRFGYSDAVAVFLGGRLLFRADSSYRGRDPSFLGIVGLHDALYLPLEEGENELLLMVMESFGGWGFMAGWGDEVFLSERVEELWTTEPVLRTPESVVFDPVDEVFYVSGYDAYRRSTTTGLQSLARVSMEGEIESLDWVGGLFHPTGLALRGRTLLVVDRGGLVEIDLEAGDLAGRRAVPGAVFLNDIALDEAGRIYLSDSAAGVVYRLDGEVAEAWVQGGEIDRPNGLHVLGEELFVGNNGDRSLKAIDLESGRVRLVARLGPGIIDGLSEDGEGNLLASHWEGRLYRITPKGEVTKILDTSNSSRLVADFTFVPERGLLAVPSFTDNRLTLYRLARDPGRDPGP